jgi:RNA polymerase sigma-70 factor (ECF subfamily)
MPRLALVPDDHAHDRRLLARVAGGDRDAFAALFDRHSPVVLGVLARMLRDRAEAEEVLQEAFLQAWQEAAGYRPEGASPRGWLLMLARSRAIDRLRSGRARQRREERTALEDGALSAGGEPPAGPARVEAAERRRTVGSALAELPEEQRRCIELAYFEGLSHTQIAARLEAPLGTVKSRVLLGMRKLRAVLEPAV